MESRRFPGLARRLGLTTAASVAAAALVGCRLAAKSRDTPAEVAGRTLTPGTTVAVLTDAAVVAFWLKAADTIPADPRRRVPDGPRPPRPPARRALRALRWGPPRLPPRCRRGERRGTRRRPDWGAGIPRG